MTKTKQLKRGTVKGFANIELQGNLLEVSNRLQVAVVDYGPHAVITHDEYQGMIEYERPETDREYEKRLTKVARAARVRTQALVKKKERLEKEQEAAARMELALYEQLRKKYEERQADG